MSYAARLGTDSAYLDLMDRTAYRVLQPGWNVPDSGGARERIVALPMLITGADADTLAANIEALQEMLTAAARAITEGDMADRVALSVRLDTTDWTHYDVRRGTLTITEHLPTGTAVYATLTLACNALVRGDAITAENLLSAPADPTDADWTLDNLTAAIDATAPDGSTTAATLSETTDNAAHTLAQTVTKAAEATQYTASVYVKPAGRTVVHLALDSAGNGASAGFTLTGAGSVSTAAAVVGTGWTGISAAIVADEGGWYRISLTATSDAAASMDVVLTLSNGSTTSYAGDTGQGVEVWGAQLEEASEAGVLLIPTYHEDTVSAAYVIPAYWLPEQFTDAALDPDDAIDNDTMSSSGYTTTASQTDPTNGTAATLFTETTATAEHYLVSATFSVPSVATWTSSLYLKKGPSGPTTVYVATGIGRNVGYAVPINLDTGSAGTPIALGTTTNYTSPTATLTDVGNGWWWVKWTGQLANSASMEIYVHTVNGSFGASYAGSTNNAVYAWRPQAVSGSSIDAPSAYEPAEFIDEVPVAAVTESAGKPNGAYLYGIPGDAPALLRLELEDASSTVAVNRLHVGSWSGPDLRYQQIKPFYPASASDGASQLSGMQTNVGTYIASLGADRTWDEVGYALIDGDAIRGRADVWPRVRDRSSFISPPTGVRMEITPGAYARRVARIQDWSGEKLTSLDFGRPIITPGATLVLAVQGYHRPSGLSDFRTASIDSDGGATWSTLWNDPPGWHLVHFWYAEDVDQLDSTLSIAISSDGVELVTATLIELIGVAAASFDKEDESEVALGRLEDGQLTVTAGPITPAQVHTVLVSFGIGFRVWPYPATAATGNWTPVSSLTTGAISYRTVTTLDPVSAEWFRVSISGYTPQDEEWYAGIAAFKGAAASASSITAGEWSIVVTALDSAGNESLATGVVSRSVPSTSSSVAVTWQAPENGTPASYRVYRIRSGSGWGYFEVTAPETSYVFTTESGITPANPPTNPPTVASYRVTVGVTSGTTTWRTQTSESSRHANSVWEDIEGGQVPLPPIVEGEGTTPEDTYLALEAAHLDTGIVDLNGFWLFNADEGQVMAWREGLDATDTPEWVLDTNRDGVTTGWLRNADGTDAGQLAVVPGALALNPGNALVIWRPEIAAEESDLVNADMRVTRVRITPRYRYLRSGGGS